MLGTHELAKIMYGATTFEYVLCDGTRLVHVLSKACVFHEVDPAFETVSQVSIAKFGYDACHILLIKHFCSHYPAISLEVFLGALQVEVSENTMKITEGSLPTFMFSMVFADLVRANALEGVTKDLFAEHTLKVR